MDQKQDWNNQFQPFNNQQQNNYEIYSPFINPTLNGRNYDQVV